MKTVPSGLATHLAERTTRLALCWQVTRRDGVVIRGTEADRDIVIASGTYAGTYLASAGITGSAVQSSADLSVDNLEVTGSLVSIVNLSAGDIEAGLFDDAPAVLFVTRWDVPGDGQLVLRRGTLGIAKRDTDGKYSTELRGITQALSQPALRSYLAICDADLGDARCGKDISALIVTATVTSVTDRRTFTCTLTGSGVAGDYVFGKLTGLTGSNTGYTRDVKRDAVSGTVGQLELWEPLPFDVVVGATFSLSPGCNKEMLGDCKNKYNNVLRFQGYGVYTPGMNKLVRGPDRGSGPT